MKKTGDCIVLGVHWSHDSSACIVTPEGCLFSVAEERITRTKHHYGFPIQSIQAALAYQGLNGADIDVVAITTRKPLFPFHKNHLSVALNGEVTGPGLTEFGKWKPGVPRGVHGKLPGPKPIESFKGTAWEGFENRHWSYYHQELAELGLLGEGTRYIYVHHHRAHASSAFRMCGMPGKKVCVLTADGKGDGYSGSISIGHEDGRMELLRSSPAEQSLGSFYQAITEALGFVPVDGEYKTMGLAALGKPGLVNPFNQTVKVQNGMTLSRIPWVFRPYNLTHPDKAVPNPLSSVSEADNYEKFLSEYSPEQVAYFAQEHLEENLLRLADDAMKITGVKNLAVAGGVMLNVKANSRIRDQLRPDKYFVYPDAADSGLAVGAALEALHVCGFNAQMSLKTPYLGTSYTDQDIAKCLERYDDIEIEAAEAWLPKRVAKELRKGMVIGTFQGRMEMGPRALGNRSVIADPRNAKVKDRINDILKGREWFVPFAPIVLEDEANKYWDGPIEYRHMTFAVEANSYAKAVVPGVVHVDGTMRPQVVNEKTNRWLFDVLNAFRELAGVGVLINTSFNRHGLPIVGSPDDAVLHLRKGWVDALAIGGFYVKRKR